MEARVLLKTGDVHRVGSGNCIDILNYPCLPNAQDPYIHNVHQALQGKRVSSLIFTDQSEWDVDLINDIF